MAGGSNVLCDVTPVRRPGLRSYRGEGGRGGRRGTQTGRQYEEEKREREKNKGEETKAAQGWRGKKREGETLSSHAAWDGPRNSADKIGASTRAGRCIHNGRPLSLSLASISFSFDLIRASRLVLDNDISKLRGLVLREKERAADRREGEEGRRQRNLQLASRSPLDCCR